MFYFFWTSCICDIILMKKYIYVRSKYFFLLLLYESLRRKADIKIKHFFSFYNIFSFLLLNEKMLKAKKKYISSGRTVFKLFVVKRLQIYPRYYCCDNLWLKNAIYVRCMPIFKCVMRLVYLFKSTLYRFLVCYDVF